MVKNEILENISDAPNFYLQKFRFGELTPSAAKLFCQYQNYTDLNIAQDRLGRFFWVAFPPSRSNAATDNSVVEGFLQGAWQLDSA